MAITNLRLLHMILLIQFILACFLIPSSAQDDGCNFCYNFENENDIPNFSENYGWSILNNSYVSGDNSISLISMEIDGPFRISFDWKKGGHAVHSGLFLFIKDDDSPLICGGSNLERITESSNENIAHTLTWKVSKTKYEDFKGYLDSICIKRTDCVGQEREPPAHPNIDFSKSYVRAGLIENVSVNEHNAGSRYHWSIDGGKILSGQGTNSISWTAIDNSDSVLIGLDVTERNGEVHDYNPIRTSVIPNSVTVGNIGQLNALINDTDNTTFDVSGNDELQNPIIINTTQYKNNRAYIIIKPLNGPGGQTTILKTRGEQDFVVAVDNSSNVSIIGFSVKKGRYGLIVENSTYIDLKENDIYPTYDDGIYVKTSDHCNIVNNIIHINTTDHESGITLFSSWHNNLSGNSVNQIGASEKNPVIIFNLTSNSNDNLVELNEKNFIFDDSGYQCHHDLNGTCSCACKDHDLCSEYSVAGSCIDSSGNNIIGSRNRWVFPSR